MAVDILGKEGINIHDLVITPRESLTRNFDIDRDVSPEQWEAMIRLVKEGMSDSPTSNLVPRAVLGFLVGKIKKEEIHHSLWNYLRSPVAAGIDDLFAVYILSPEKLPQVFNNSQERIDHYNLVKQTFQNSNSMVLNYLRLYIFGTVYKDLFDNDQEFKEIAYKISKTSLIEDAIDFPRGLTYSGLRVAFPNDNFWKEGLTQEDLEELKENIEANPIDDLISWDVIAGYILSADSVQVTDHGLEIKFDKPIQEEKPLPERRKY